MMNPRLLSFLFLAILLFIPVAFAADVEVDITPKAIDAKPCGIAAYDILIKNVGEAEDTYTFSVDGIPEGWFKLSQDSITLGSGVSQKIYLFITPNCYEENYGLFEGTFIVTDGGGNSVDFTLNVIPDHVLKLEIPAYMKVCLGEDNEMKITVKNMGNYTEEIYLTASGDAGGFVTFSEATVKLNPFEQKEITANVLTEGDYGNYSLNIEAKSSTSYARSSAAGVIEVTKCYDVEVIFPEEVKACSGEAKTFGLTIENIGVKDDTYTLTVAELNYSLTVSLAPGDFRTIDLEFLKEEEITYDIPFKVESNVVTKEGIIKFMVEKCYGVELTLENNEIDIESGKGGLVKGTVKNVGTLTDTFNIISDVIWSVIRPDKVTLESGKEEDVYAYYSPEYGATGTVTTKLTAKSVKSEDTEELTIDVLAKEEIPTTTVTQETTTVVEETTTVAEETTTSPEEETTTETTTVIEETTTAVETTTTPWIPTGSIIDIIYENRAIRSLLIAIIVVIIILIIIYLVVMR